MNNGLSGSTGSSCTSMLSCCCGFLGSSSTCELCVECCCASFPEELQSGENTPNFHIAATKNSPILWVIVPVRQRGPCTMLLRLLYQPTACPAHLCHPTHSPLPYPTQNSVSTSKTYRKTRFRPARCTFRRPKPVQEHDFDFQDVDFDLQPEAVFSIPPKQNVHPHPEFDFRPPI